MLFGGRTAGYVGVNVKEGDVSGLINILMARNIPVWQLRKDTEGFYFKIPLPYLAKTRKIAHSCGCYLTVADRGGLPFFIKRMFRRRNLWLMTVVIVGLLLLFTSSILRVEATYEDGMAMDETMTEAILATAANSGIHPFVLKHGVDYDAAADAITDAFPDVSWVGFDISGVTVTLRVAAKEAESAQNNDYGHIVATKNGVIRQVFVLKGQKKVEIGDTVETGDILISGLITYEEEGKEPVSEVTSAKGTVTASVWYEGVSYVSLNGMEVVPTGEAAGMVTLSKAGETYMIWGSDENPFDDSVTDAKQIPFLFGLTFQVKTFAEAEAKETRLTADAALALAEKQAKARAAAEIPEGTVVLDEKTEKLTDKSGAVGVRYIIETEEEIGTFSVME